MADWFQVDKIDRNTYAISEPAHWEEPHCYLLLGKARAVLIDTGLGVSNIRKIIDTLTSLPVLVVTTHVHWDHIGGHGLFERFAIHESEQEWISDRFPLPLDTVRHSLTCQPCYFPVGFDPMRYQIFQGDPVRFLRDGDILDLGGRRLQVLHTPGHSPGHCCFYEPEQGFLYSGDLIYRGCLDVFYPTTDPVLFYQSVKKVRRLDIRRIFPGHHSLNVPPDIIGRMEAALEAIYSSGHLHHGSGIYDFGDFQIHL
ncbi:MAG: MBL fold metallo-hydrolase [Oscillospiraceae bacterium]|nr:MBL fold metallo-hydrolase [Oscillospiraceae bacterium]